MRVLVRRRLSIWTVLPWIRPQSSCVATNMYSNLRWPNFLARVRDKTYDHAFTPEYQRIFFSNLTSVSGHKATSRHRVWVSFALLTKHWFKFFFCIITSSTLPNSHLYSYKHLKNCWARRKHYWHRRKHTCMHIQHPWCTGDILRLYVMNPLGSARVIVIRRGGYPRYVFKPLASTGLGIQSPYSLNFS